MYTDSSTPERSCTAASAFALLLALALGAPAAVANDDAAELEALVADLVQAARGDDASAIDEPACLDWFASAHSMRAEALGLVEDASAPEALDAYKSEYRAAVRAFVAERSGGAAVESVDVSQVEIPEEAENLAVAGSDGSPVQLPITGAGQIQIRWQGGAVASGVPVARIGDYWCLNPVSP